MIVTLWQDQAQSFDAERFHDASATTPVYVLFVGMTVGTFSGAILCYHACYLTYHTLSLQTHSLLLSQRCIYDAIV